MPSAVHPYRFDDRRMLRWQKEGRGAGSGDDYQPWLKVGNVRSRGRKHRMPGIKADRVMHLMSDLERNAVLLLERRDDVVDLREQFPLDRERTRRIATQMGVRHPRDPMTACDIVMTTDLLVTFRLPDGTLVDRAKSIKPLSELSNERVLEKLEIERRYWTGLGFDWALLTDAVLRDKPGKERFRTLLWLRGAYWLERVDGLSSLIWEARCRDVLEALASCSELAIADVVSKVDGRNDLEPGQAMLVLRHLAARKRVNFDPRLGIPSLADPASRFELLPAQVWSLAA